MRALPLRAAPWSAALMCPILFASTAVVAQSEHDSAPSAKPVIALAPSAVPDAYRLPPKAGEASFENPPANFHAFASAHVGEIADEEPLTLKFNASTRLTKIELSKDFLVGPASSCQVGNRYSEGDSCVLLVRFTPQGAGRRLGKLTISHTASPRPMAFGIGGNGYAPVLSFTPALITTVPGTYTAGAGLLSGAKNLAVDGSDTLYVADTGNGDIRFMDSSATFKNLASGQSSPLGIAVDTFGQVYFDEPAANAMYEIYDYGPVVKVSGTGTASCPAATPCTLSTEALGTPGEMSMDPYNHLFFVDSHQGAAFSTVQPIPAKLIFLYDPFPYQQSPSAAMAVDAGDNLYSLWANGGVCEIVQQSLYNAENSNVSFNKVAGGHTCGFSGDGGQAGNAEIGAKIGQIAFDSAGNLYFSDTNNERVRRIDYTTGQINTIAGNGVAGVLGDGSQATSAELNSPTGVAVDSQGQVYIISSVTSGQVIRKLGPNGQLNFPNQAKGTKSSAYVVRVSNTGNSAMTLTSYNLGGTNAGDFAIDATTTSCILTTGATLYAAQSCKVGIIFAPSASGTRTATLNFLNNTVTGTNTVGLTGTGTSPAPTITITAPASGATETSGTAFSFSVKVSSTTSPAPTGTVKMLLDGAAISGSPATLNGSGVATLSVTLSTSGSHTLSATYNGDSNYAAAGPITRTFTVAAAALRPTKAAVKSSANPAAVCNSVAFSVTVTGTGGETPTGMVKLMKGMDVLGAAWLSNGAASIPNLQLGVGTYVLTASYEGDSTHAASTSAPFSQVVSNSGACTPILRQPRPLQTPIAFLPR